MQSGRDWWRTLSVSLSRELASWAEPVHPDLNILKHRAAATPITGIRIGNFRSIERLQIEVTITIQLKQEVGIVLGARAYCFAGVEIHGTS